MRYTVTVPVLEWLSWPTIAAEVRQRGEEEARKLGLILPDTEPRIVSGIDTMRYAQWRWEA